MGINIHHHTCSILPAPPVLHGEDVPRASAINPCKALDVEGGNHPVPVEQSQNAGRLHRRSWNWAPAVAQGLLPLTRCNGTLLPRGVFLP